MSIAQMGNEEWDFVDARGAQRQVAECESAATSPESWRVFGPFEPDPAFAFKQNAAGISIEPRTGADVARLADIPAELTVDGVTRKGLDVSMVDGALNLQAMFDLEKVQEGRFAYLMAEVEVDRPGEVVFGAGCDWWMQWWIDGEPAFDTMDTGNLIAPIGCTDHCFSRHLTVGKHVLVIKAVSGMGGWTVGACVPTSLQAALSAASTSDQWEFVPEANMILRPYHPVDTYQRPSIAIRTDRCLSGETIECEYQQPVYDGQVGIVFGAQDSEHYYYAYVPNWGQLHRARAFYAAIGVADGAGFIRNLDMRLMHNIPVQHDTWKSLKVERRGDRIQMWVAGVKGPCVTDSTYGPGRCGIAGYSKYMIRNLQISGTPADAPSWQPRNSRKVPWHEPVPDLSRGPFQALNGIFRLSDEEILLASTGGEELAEPPQESHKAEMGLYFRRTWLFLSDDAGRTWTQHGEPVPVQESPRFPLFAPQPGVLRSIKFVDDGSEGIEMKMVYQDSLDKALTWSEPIEAELLGSWHEDIFIDNTLNNSLIGFTELRDGTLLGVILHRCEEISNKAIPKSGIGTWGTGKWQPYCTTSKDQGLSWSQPAQMDDTRLVSHHAQESPCGDFTETPMAELPDGRVVAISRPVRAPYTWQTHSDDGGQTWSMCCYAPFSIAGWPNLVVTQSGYLVAVGRGAGVEMRISTDGGINWDHGTMIDTPGYFNGYALEVEPDVLLVVYPSFDEHYPSKLRAQRIRITPDGPIPLGCK